MPLYSNLLTACGAAIVLWAGGCALVLGCSVRTWIEDLLMVLLTEGTMALAFRTSLDWVHLHGRALTDWSLIAGTGLALTGILLNHLARRAPTGKKHRAG